MNRLKNFRIGDRCRSLRSFIKLSFFDGSDIPFQDVLIEYAKTDGDASIVQDPDDPNNQLILKSTAKQVNKCLFSQAPMHVIQNIYVGCHSSFKSGQM